jgi:murein L,D-transpeptidase YcbB/YkuD
MRIVVFVLTEDEGEDEEAILSKQDAKVLKDLKLQTEPYAQIAEQNLELLAMLAESEVAKETVESASKELLEIISEKEKELLTSVDKCKQQERDLEEVNKQLMTERDRVSAAKSLYRLEVAKRKKLIGEAVPTEKEIDQELEES